MNHQVGSGSIECTGYGCDECATEDAVTRKLRLAQHYLIEGRVILAQYISSQDGDYAAQDVMRVADDHLHDALTVLMGGDLEKDGKVGK